MGGGIHPPFWSPPLSRAEGALWGRLKLPQAESAAPASRRPSEGLCPGYPQREVRGPAAWPLAPGPPGALASGLRPTPAPHTAAPPPRSLPVPSRRETWGACPAAHLLRHRLTTLLTMLLEKYCLASCGWEASKFLTV